MNIQNNYGDSVEIIQQRCCSVYYAFDWSPVSTTRVDGWPVSITRQHGPCWRVMETGHPSTRVVETGLYSLPACD